MKTAIPPHSPLPRGFHPYLAQWFRQHFVAPSPAQKRGWGPVMAGRDTLIAAPTGSGKTLAAFLWSLNQLVRAALKGQLEDRTYVVYVSPLKALGNDIHKNLQVPMAEIGRIAQQQGEAPLGIRVAVRSGDTPNSERQSMLRRPPHILITTPESLYILLTAKGSRGYLAGAGTVIVDEIHAVAGDKRGSHLALSLERLDHLAGRRLQRIGLSATQKPVAAIASLLVGTPGLRPKGRVACSIVDVGHQRDLELSIAIPDLEFGPIATLELWEAVYERIATEVRAHRSTLVFVHTRRLAERVAHKLSQRLGEDQVATHHGSLSKESRLAAEQQLKSGGIAVVVATASLELGIDIGHVDLVCHIGAPRSIASLLQRIGRSGHGLDTIPKGLLFPLTRDELLQTAAAVRAVRAGELDRIHIPEKPLDILAQQMVATVASGEIAEQDLWELCRKAFPYRHLTPGEFAEVVEILSEGIATRRGRGSAYLHRDGVHHRLRPRRNASLAAITGGGAIPDTADYDVIQEPAGISVGRVNEDFAIESMAGDIFLLGNQSWRIRRVERGKLRVEDAQGAAPTIPFWLGEAPARTAELSGAVSELRHRVTERLGREPVSAVDWLSRECGLDRSGAEQLVAYITQTRAVLGEVPTQQTVVAERFFDESGGMQLVLHAPFGGRINRAWGLALRKRFCVSFNFELQAAATDDGVVISLGEQHSFPLQSVASMVRPDRTERDLIQAVLASPMFGNRWRWNATRFLALQRFQHGRRVPMPIQRMRAEDLLAAVFPAQLACQDNAPGPVEPVDHPLVNQTLHDCLHEPLDLEGFLEVLRRLESGEIGFVGRDTPAPSPMSHEILNANPYAFLDDAPLEERRARAVSLRRMETDAIQTDPILDPEVVAGVASELWPDIRDREELHDLLLNLVILPSDAVGSWQGFMNELIESGRAGKVAWTAPTGSRQQAYVAAERLGWLKRVVSDVGVDPAFERRSLDSGTGSSLLPATSLTTSRLPKTSEDVTAFLVREWLECLGPATAAELADRLGLTRPVVQLAMVTLEAGGTILRGRFRASPGLPAPNHPPSSAVTAISDASSATGSLSSDHPGPDTEWCERRILARIHRLTLGRLRREIEPAGTTEFIRFLLHWQHLEDGTQLHGREGLLKVLQQLQGLELPATAWERDILPKRIVDYRPEDLEALCLSGMVAWGRLRFSSPPSLDREGSSVGAIQGRTKPGRSAPLAFFTRQDSSWLLESRPLCMEEIPGLSPAAVEVANTLRQWGACFLADISRSTGRLAAEVEDALWELVSRGLVTGDGMAGLRVLLLPHQKRRRPEHRLRVIRGGNAPGRLLPLGRWSLLQPQRPHLPDNLPGDLPRPDEPGRRMAAPRQDPDEFASRMANQLLRRYGIVIRELLTREAHAPRWRTLLRVYRRMEARGEIRGGRFVSAFGGEQFALPEAVDTLRALRRGRTPQNDTVLVSAADPLNLAGILTPGARVSSYSHQWIAIREGLPVEVGELGEVLSRLQPKRPSGTEPVKTRSGPRSTGKGHRP